MFINKQHRLLFRLMGLILLFTALLFPRWGFGETVDIYQQAKSLLKESTTFLARQKRFSVNTRSSIEVVLRSGQKIQFDQAVSLSMQRPDKLRADRHNDLVDQVFYYDGESLTLHNPSDKYYATVPVPVPGTIEAMLDYARKSLDIFAPAGDLLYTNAYEILMQDVTDGFVVGKSVIEGVHCDHIAFRSPHVDWQIWVQEGSKPLPHKLVITSKDVVNAPQFTVVMTNWDLTPEFDDGLFTFKSADDMQKIDFLPK